MLYIKHMYIKSYFIGTKYTRIIVLHILGSLLYCIQSNTWYFEGEAYATIVSRPVHVVLHKLLRYWIPKAV